MAGAPHSEEPRQTDGGSGWLAFAAIAALFLAGVVAVDPGRECPVRDDWAYAQTVDHLLKAHEYRLNEWLSANCPFQTAWAAAFCILLGESFSAMRASTVALALVGLFAFRGLAIENGLSRAAANLLTLCMATSSLFFQLSLTFLTDVPFVSTLTVALWLFSRALRRSTFAAWLTAALAGAAAILTRQFGAAIVPAVAMVWLFDPKRKERIGHYLLGLSLPGAATAWQLNQGWYHSNWAAAFLLKRQSAFLLSGNALKQLPWRPTVLAEYQALWLIPLVLLAVAMLFQTVSRSAERRDWRKHPLVAWIAWCAVFAASVAYGWAYIGFYHWDAHASSASMPFVPHCYDILDYMPAAVRWGVTVFVVAGGALFAQIFVARWISAVRGELRPQELLLDFTALFSLALTLVFVQFFDQYILVYLPYAAIVVGKRVADPLVRKRGTVIACCVLLLAGAVVWTREDLAKDEAMWGLSEQLRADGIPPEKIYSDWKWLFFWQFEDAVHAGKIAPSMTYPELFSDGWLKRKQDAAEYWVVLDPKPPAGELWTVLHEWSYFSFYARGRETFYAVRRTRVGTTSKRATQDGR